LGGFFKKLPSIPPKGLARAALKLKAAFHEEERLKIEKIEYRSILKQLIVARLKYQPVSNWSVLFANLAAFAGDSGFKVVVRENLQSLYDSSGCIWPRLKIIAIQKCNVTKMIPALAHEIGHLICFKAGILRKYSFDEDLAEFIGDVLFDLLSK